MRFIRSLLALQWAFVTCACGSEAAICEPGALSTALSEARPGDVVRVGACTLRGHFVVGAGVVLEGVGEASVLESDGDAAVIELAAGEGAIVRGLHVEVLAGGYGVLADGSGDAQIERTSFSVERGVGIGARGRGRVVIRDVRIEGPLDAASAAFAPADRALTGTWGVIAIDVGELGDPESGVRVEGLRASGLAIGALSVERSVLDWVDDDVDADGDGADDVDVARNRGLGIAVFESIARVRGVELGGALVGAPVPFAIGIAAVSSPELSLEDVTLTSGEGYGVFTDASTVIVRSLRASGLALAGMRIQAGTLDAEGVTLEGNGGAGIAILDGAEVTLRDAMIARQRMAAIPTSAGGNVMMGDGVLVRGEAMAPALTMEDVTLEDNARAGLLIDLAGGAPASISIARVTASASGVGLGVVAQDATLPVGWDSGVTRAGAAIVNDAAFPGGLELVGIIMPPASMLRPTL